MVLRSHRLLEVDCALHRVGWACELDQHAVAVDLENTAAVFPDNWLQDLLAARFQRRKRAAFIVLHEAAETHDISRHDCCETALRTGVGHRKLVPSRSLSPLCISTRRWSPSRWGGA